METINFIKGSFTPGEAKEILLEVLTKKINFHNLKNYSSVIRFDQPDEESEQRLEELRAAKANVLVLIEEARRENLNFIIESTINIVLEGKGESAVKCLKAESY